jgi:8-oxo-dGTP pyrophosphatase MutT (NUDIX family)
MSETRPLAPASTILIVRDAPGLQVLMVQRHHQIDFASGALVFPGGKTAAEDSDPRWAAFCDGDAGAEDRAYRIAAIREAFEESGLLLARRAASRGPGAPFAAPGDFDTVFAERDAIAAGKASFLAAIERAGLVLALDALTFYAHWITPEGLPKRFDTRFYIAEAPDAQEALCDGSETVDACWIAPQQALADMRAKKRTIIFPTRLNLELLGKSASAAEALAASRARKIVEVLPRITRVDGVQMLNIPAEAGYSVTTEPLDGNRP